MAGATFNSTSLCGRLFRLSSLVLVVTLCSRTSYAQATETEENALEACAEAYESSQQYRKQLALLRAREQLLTCLRSECPAPLREDCSPWIEEVERAIPSITVEATADGVERSDVKVELEGQIIAEQLDVRGIEVDPGSHVFRFHLPPYPPVERRIMLRVGQKLRKLSVEFVTPGSERRSASAARASVPKDVAPQTHRPIPMVAYVLGGTTVVAAGSFAYWGLRSNSERDTLRDECAPKCTDEDVQPLQRFQLYANVSAAVAGAALIGGVVAYLTRPSEKLTTGSRTFTVASTPNSMTGALHFTF